MAKTILQLKGKTAVFIDWANVYYWKEALKKEVDPKKLFEYLQSYDNVKQIRFYFGTDQSHPASAAFLNEIRQLGYEVVTKDVKFLKKYNEERTEYIWVRKCDFDLEIGLDCFEQLDDFDSFIFFSGDGDFATLYKRLIKREKHIIVIFAHGVLGREVFALQRGIFKCSVTRLQAILK